jgi:hypothetical protein
VGSRGASFVAKVKATKGVWFPPKPIDTGTTAASTAKKTTEKATGQATTKTTAAAKKATNDTK